MRLQFTLAARYLNGRRLRTFLTTLAIVLGVALIFGLNTYLPGFIQAFQKNTLAIAGKVDLSVTSRTGEAFAPGIADKVRSVDGVADVTPSLKLNMSLPPGETGVTALGVVGVDPSAAQKVRSYPLQTGRFLKISDANAVAVSTNLARQLKLKVGDTLTVPSASGTTQLKVVGLLKMPSQPGVEQVYVPLKTAQDIFAQDQRINSVEATYTAAADRTAVTREVRTKLGSGYKLGAVEMGTELFASIQIGQFAMNLFGLMALLMGAFIILNTFRTAVAERRHDIGMLRAIGASKRTILGAFLAEGVLQGAIGAALGVVAGYGLALALFAAINPIVKQYLHFSVSAPPFELNNLIIASSLGVGVAVLGALAPAFSASRVTPVEALRPAVGETYERATRWRAWAGAVVVAIAVATLLTRSMSLAGLGVVLFLIGIVLVAPALIKPISDVMGLATDLLFRRESSLAKSNVARQPNRAAITASAVMISLAILIGMSGVITSIFDGFTSYLDKSMGTDFLVMPQSLILSSGNVGAAPELGEKIKAIDGMGPVASFRLARTQVNGTAVQVIGIDPKTFSSIATLDFSEGSTSRSFDKLTSGRYLIANGIYAAQNGLKEGRKLTLSTPEGDRVYTVAAIGSDYLNAKLSTVYTSQANLARDFHAEADILFLANAQPGADTAEVHRELNRVLSAFPAFTLYDVATWRKLQLEAFNQSQVFFYMLIMLLALPSLLALINTLTINIVARMHEIGMLRAVGGTRRQIRRMILAESLMLASIGTAFGIMAGLWLGYVLVGAMNSAGFKMPYYFPWGGILMTIAVGLIFGVLASVLPARQAARVNIVDALHYE